MHNYIKGSFAQLTIIHEDFHIIVEVVSDCFHFDEETSSFFLDPMIRQVEGRSGWHAHHIAQVLDNGR